MEKSKEVWKDVVGYEGIYQVSDHGRVMSLKYGKKRLLKLSEDSRGYLRVCLRGEDQKVRRVHQLVAEAFLDHTPCGHKEVVDHIDHDKTNNYLSNLRLLTHRENSSHLKKKGSSQYPGVCWDKNRKKWVANIQIKSKLKYLGRFTCEHEAAQAYQNALKDDEE